MPARANRRSARRRKGASCPKRTYPPPSRRRARPRRTARMRRARTGRPSTKDGRLGDLADRAEKAEAELAAMRAERDRAETVADVAKGANVPAELLSLMRGDTAEVNSDSGD